MDKEQAVKLINEGRAKRREMLDTMFAVKGEEYVAMVDAGTVVINFVNMMTDAGNNGAVHPSLAVMLRVVVPDVQHAISTLLALITIGDDGKAESVTADINALLGLVEEANRKMNAGVAK